MPNLNPGGYTTNRKLKRRRIIILNLNIYFLDFSPLKISKFPTVSQKQKKE
jgi:hypothetical protein